MQVHGLYPRPAESESLKEGPRGVLLKPSLSMILWLAKYENTVLYQGVPWYRDGESRLSCLEGPLILDNGPGLVTRSP